MQLKVQHAPLQCELVYVSFCTHQSTTTTDLTPPDCSQVARCDACGREGKLKEGLRTLAEVRHFCDLKCLLRFFNKKVTAGTFSRCVHSGG